MPDFEIKIKTPTELAGAVACADQLERNIGKAKALGKEFGEMEEQLKNVKKSIADYDEAAAGGAEKSEKFGEKNRELREALRAVNEHIGNIGISSREMGSGFGIAAGVATAAIGALIAWLDAADKAENAFAASAAKGVGQTISEQGEAASNAAAAHEALAEALNRAATGETSLMTAMNNRIKAFDDYITGLEKVAKAEDAAEEQRIQRQVRNQEITPEQGQEKIAGIHRAAEQRADAGDVAKTQKRYEEEAKTLAEAQAKKNAADAEALAKKDAAEKAANDAKRAEARKKGEEELLYGEGGDWKNPKPDSAQGWLNQATAAKENAITVRTDALPVDPDSGPWTAVGKHIESAVLGALQKTGQIFSLGFYKPSKPENATNALGQTEAEAQAARDQQKAAADQAAQDVEAKKKAAADAASAAEQAAKKAMDVNKTIAELGGDNWPGSARQG
jgi:hypothetical protein